MNDNSDTRLTKNDTVDIVYDIHNLTMLRSTRQTQLQDQQTISSTNNKLVFTTTYSPHIKQETSKKHYCKTGLTYKKTKHAGYCFPKNRLGPIAYKRNKNISDLLVNSKLRKQNNSPKTTTIQTQQQVDPNIEMLVSLLEEQEY